MTPHQPRGRIAISNAIADCQLHAPHRVPLLQAAYHGVIGLLEMRRECGPDRLTLLQATPAIILIGDDDHRATGPKGWRCRRELVRWASHAIIHAAAGEPDHYRVAVLLAVQVGRVAFIETTSAHARTWHCVFADFGKPTINIVPGDDVHPAAVSPERMR